MQLLWMEIWFGILYSFICGIGSILLYFYKDHRWYSNIICAIPSSILFEEGISCFHLLITQHILFIQTVFDLFFTFIFIKYFYKYSKKNVFWMTFIIFFLFTF